MYALLLYYTRYFIGVLTLSTIHFSHSIIVDDLKDCVYQVTNTLIRRDPITTQTALLKASQEGKLLTTHYLLHVPNININVTNEFGSTPLILAVREGHVALASRLLKAPRIDVNARNKNGFTALVYALDQKDSTLTQMLLNRPDISIQHAMPYGYTLLTWALHNNKLSYIPMLIRLPTIDLNAHDEHGNTALMMAIKGNHPSIAPMLLDTDLIDVNAPDNTGTTPLLGAIHHNYEDVVALLLTKPTLNVNYNRAGETALIAAIHRYQSNNTQSTFIKLLLTTPSIDVNQGITDGKPPLHAAIHHTMPSTLFSLFLSAPGANHNILDVWGNSPLVSATSTGNEALIQQLLALPEINVDLSNSKGNTPLMIAAQKGYAAIASLLLRAGADTTCRNKKGQTALDIAQEPEDLWLFTTEKLEIARLIIVHQRSLAVAENEEDIMVKPAID